MKRIACIASIVLALGITEARADHIFRPPPPAPLVLCPGGYVTHAPCPYHGGRLGYRWHR